VLQFDARIIAATNKDLKEEVASQRFRQDLFYRLNVIPIEVPPLRDRADDIPLLIEHYLDYFRREYGRPKVALTSPAVEVLSRYHWPGNVRELRNVIERLVIMAAGDEVGPDDVRLLLESTPSPAPTRKLSLTLEPADPEEGLLRRLLEAAEREILESELAKAEWNVSQAARNLGIDRANLHRKMRRLGIERGT
jgi:two-component system, NtrC family, nitrogen regulation response regulator NtrX